jgi:hypothetical protein
MSSKVGFLGAAELGKFVLRSQVLSLYRKFFRTARDLPAQQKGKEEAVLAVFAACGSASLAHVHQKQQILSTQTAVAWSSCCNIRNAFELLEQDLFRSWKHSPASDNRC